ncbi:YtxH domain-containing protein [Microterricola viridarii]|uniref:YtxH domain-containing protein n=1 Tax=Microterricola viridarii TaxID=412690 RepID=UPI001900DD03|nr:YtxH domain-containing protein [Microterricola viridarii]
MKGKLLFLSGAAVGYVLGTRAGRKRYEQIKEAAAGVWNTPTVQRGIDQAKDFALTRVSIVSDAVFDGAKKLVNSAARQSAESARTSEQSTASARTSGQRAESPRPAGLATESTYTVASPTTPSSPNRND